MSMSRNGFYVRGLFLGMVAVLVVLALVPNMAVAEPGTVAASEHLVKNISLTPTSPNFVRIGQDVTVNFDYQTTEPGGVRIFARPFSGGAASPGYLASSSPVYPPGSGSGSGNFTINTEPVIVDEIRFQMWDASQSTLLFEAFIPVHYDFTNADDPVYDVEFDPVTPNVMRHGDKVNLQFKYITDQVGGVRIFVLPFADGSPAPGYSVNPSPLYPTGSGSGDGFFQFNGGDVTVDAVRLRMTNADQSLLLFEGFLPVHYQYGGGSNRVYNLELAPPTANILDLGEDVNLSFDYATNWPGGVRIFIRPLKDGELAPGYSAHASPVYSPPSGNGSGFFTINAAPLVVDGIRIRITSPDDTILLYETVVPVHYQFGALTAEEEEYLIYLPLTFADYGG